MTTSPLNPDLNYWKQRCDKLAAERDEWERRYRVLFGQLRAVERALENSRMQVQRTAVAAFEQELGDALD